jgi:hypothetical protein
MLLADLPGAFYSSSERRPINKANSSSTQTIKTNDSTIRQGCAPLRFVTWIFPHWIVQTVIVKVFGLIPDAGVVVRLS